MRKTIILAIASLALAAPAFAQAPTTLQEVTSKGITLDVGGGMQIDVAYKPDGTFSAMDGQVTGKWRIDGEKLCTTSNMSPAEECVAYPAGKKSGDSFEVTGGAGAATITIK